MNDYMQSLKRDEKWMKEIERLKLRNEYLEHVIKLLEEDVSCWKERYQLKCEECDYLYENMEDELEYNIDCEEWLDEEIEGYYD